MAAAYDTYDYQAYWEGREYEHDAEAVAIQAFLNQIPKIETALEIGAGFGRLVDTYSFRAKKVVITDPSSKLLKIAKEMHLGNKYKFLQSSAELLPKKVHKSSIDLIILVRVLHHIVDPQEVFCMVNKLLTPGGYFILEFANKKHWKEMAKEIFKGNILFPVDIFPKDIRSEKNVKRKTLPFINYHPDAIFKMLTDAGFEITEKRSVSNIRIPTAKKLLPPEVLLGLEKRLQVILAPFNSGPSIFVLARKVNAC